MLSVDAGRLAERVRRSNSGSTVCATEVTSKRTEKNMHPHVGVTYQVHPCRSPQSVLDTGTYYDTTSRLHTREDMVRDIDNGRP
ncbi:hypothetical protein JB92DRAFT_2799864 [Gautieria morchelliformis]|nr:hypothetical protein JB92DRAFT_2799864 [Gautieria morchelliformis]